MPAQVCSEKYFVWKFFPVSAGAFSQKVGRKAKTALFIVIPVTVQ